MILIENISFFHYVFGYNYKIKWQKLIVLIALVFAFFLFSFRVFSATLLSSIASNPEKLDISRLSYEEKKAAIWLIPYFAPRSTIQSSILQLVIHQFLSNPYFPNAEKTYDYIIDKSNFLEIEDKFLLINFITNHTHFAQTFVNKYKIPPHEFQSIIIQAKEQNVLNESFKNHILESYSSFVEIDKKITNKPNLEFEKEIYNLTDASEKALLYARLYILGNNKYKDFYKITLDENLNSEMLLYEKIFYHYKHKNIEEIVKYIYDLPPTLAYSRHWWKTSKQLILDLLDAGYKEEAYNLMGKIYLPQSSPSYIHKEMLTGAIAMLNSQPNYAYEHFYNIYENAKNITNKAQGAYFLAMTYKEMNNNEAYNFWINKTLKYPTTYYSILAINEINNSSSQKILGSQKYLTEDWYKNNEKHRKVYKKYLDEFIVKNFSSKKQKRYQDLPENILNMLKIAAILKDNAQYEHAKSFILNSISIIEDLSFMTSTLEYICNNYNKYICIDAQAQAQKIGYIDINSFKIIKSSAIEKTIERNHMSLLHSIIKQESNFKEVVTSRVGAQGMMQIMPGTAKLICTKHSIPYNSNKLKNDAEYNILLGTTYLNDLLEKYQGSYVKTLIAYNAGWGNLNKWETRYLKPSTQKEMSLMTELIPFDETRNYVKQIITRETIYDYILEASK